MINELKLHLSKLVEDYTKRKYLLAVSGGMDSVVLAHLFKALELDFTLAHCNFQLRGVDSDADERFVSILSNQLSRNFKVKRFEVDTYIQSHKMSVQMAARTLRYTWFEQLAKEGDYDFIVTAHHKNDLAETMLLNMVKGTGYAGLVGIKSLNNHLLRPLLAFEKSQIEAYANRQGIQWREDSSNSLDKYQRNHLRLHVMPLLKAVNPKVEDALFRTSEKIGAAQAFIKYQIEMIKSEAVKQVGDGHIEIGYSVMSLGYMATFVLSELLRDYGFDYYKCERISLQDKSEPGASFLSDTHHLVCDRDKFVITPLADMATVRQWDEIPEQFEYANYRFEALPYVFDKDKVHSKWELIIPEKLMKRQLVIRPMQVGDSMAPFGMHGKRKKVSDLLNEAKIPLNLKNYIPIFQIDQEIFWLVGLRASHYCKVENGEQAVVIKAIKV